MHDIAKVEGGDDSTHPQRGSQYAYNMLNGVISDDDRETVANLIFNHHFGEYMEHNNDSNNNEKMFTLAYECNDKNLQFIDMLEILGEADLKGDDEDYNISRSEYCEQIPERIQALRTQIQCIDDILKKLEDSLELTPFPQKTVDMTTELQNNEKTMSIKQECKDLRIIGEFESEGVKIPKIDLSKMKDVSCDKQKEYLEFLGFGENSNYNNLEFLIHAINGASQIDGIDYVTNQFKPDSTLSTSIITMANTTTFKNRKYGFIMDPRSTKVLYADTANISSGYAKSRNESGKYIFSSQNIDYAELSNYIHASRDKVKDEHSELITIDNKIAAIFVKEGAENDVPLRLVQFAHQYNLPLVIVPNTKFQEA